MGVGRKDISKVYRDALRALVVVVVSDLGHAVDSVAVAVEGECIVRLGPDAEDLPAGAILLHVPQVDTRLLKDIVVVHAEIDGPAYAVALVYERTGIHVCVVARCAAALDGEVCIVGRVPPAAVYEDGGYTVVHPCARGWHVAAREVETRCEEHVYREQSVRGDASLLQEPFVDGHDRGVIRLAREPIFCRYARGARARVIEVVAAARRGDHVCHE